MARVSEVWRRSGIESGKLARRGSDRSQISPVFRNFLAANACSGEENYMSILP